MDADYDPRARRLNPLIDELVATLDESWQSILSSSDYLQRKGRLRTLRQIIDQIIEEPEWLEADLQEGAASERDCWFLPEEFDGEPAPVFSDERPFDRPGAGAGSCFLYADTGKLSHLYEGEPIDPLVGPLRHHGPWIYTLEKHLATQPETVNRAIHANLWEQLVPADDGRADQQGARALILCDPRGIGGGDRTLCVARYADIGRAVTVAQDLAEELGIRFVVARERRKWCTR